MLLIPLACVEVAAHHLSCGTAAIPTAALRNVAGQCEVAVDELDEELSDTAVAIWAQTRKLWNRQSREDVGDGRWVRTTRVVFAAQQQDGGKRLHGANLPKRDLTVAYQALQHLGPANLACQEFLQPGANAADIEPLGVVYGAQVHDLEDGSRTLQMRFLQPRWWPPELGCGTSLSECERTLTLGGRYAAWRDRPLRRLRSVEVTVTELWAIPPTHL
jgi:hypothetical protein